MAEDGTPQAEKLSWKFPRTFWYANGAELCERAAFYGMFITLVRYLNQDIGFTDVQAGIVSAAFSSTIYLFPTFMGIMADKIGFKQALMIAFTLLTAGYTLLGAFQIKATALLALTLIMLGGAIIKPVISGTVAKCSDATNRARAMSIFYMVVNIGSFSGKSLAGPLNNELGLQCINFYSAGMALLALVLVGVFYRNPDVAGVGKSVGEALRGLGRVLLNVRFDLLIIIIGGFWAIQGQLYGAMPTYVERLLGRQYQPEWLANINPFVVVLFVVPITHLIRNFTPANAIGIGPADHPVHRAAGGHGARARKRGRQLDQLRPVLAAPDDCHVDNRHRPSGPGRVFSVAKVAGVLVQAGSEGRGRPVSRLFAPHDLRIVAVRIHPGRLPPAGLLPRPARA